MAARGNQRQLQEYLVSLGVQVDQRGMNRMVRALNMTKVTAMGITTALVGMTVALVKGSQSLTDATRKYEDMARAGKKSAEAIAQQEMALKIMGKTLDEVNKNERLKKIYDSLQAVQKEMALPAAGEGRKSLDDFTESINSFKLTTLYVFHWINHHFLEKLAVPLRELRNDLEDMRKNLMINMPRISQTVGNALANFVRLLLAGGKGIRDLTGYIKDLPDGVKTLIGTLTGLWGIMKASPVFWVLAGLTSLLLLLEDFQGWKEGRQSAFGDIWSGLSDGTFGDEILNTLADTIEQVQSKFEDFAAIGAEISAAILKGITAHDFEQDGVAIGGFLSKLFSFLGDTLNNEDMLATLSNIGQSMGRIATGILKAIATGLRQVDWSEAGADVGTFLSNMFTEIVTTIDKVANGEGDEGGFLVALADAAKSVVVAIVNALAGFMGSLDGAGIAEALLSFIENLFTQLMGIVQDDDADELGLKIGEIIIGAIKFVGDFAKTILKGLFGGLSEAVDADAGEGEDSARTIGEKIMQAILDAIVFTVQNGLKILSDIFSAIIGATEEGEDSGVGEAISGLLMNGIKFTTQFIRRLLNDLGALFGTDEAQTMINNIGNGIGIAIGSVIKIGIGFIKDLATDLIEFITSPDGIDKFMEVGKSIVAAIISGVDGLIEGIWDAIFGSGSYQRMVGIGKQQTAVARGEVVAMSESGERLNVLEFSGLDADQQKIAIQAGASETTRAQSITGYYGINDDWMTSRRQHMESPEARRAYEDMQEIYQEARREGLYDVMAMAAEWMSGFQGAYERGERGEALAGLADYDLRDQLQYAIWGDEDSLNEIKEKAINILNEIQKHYDANPLRVKTMIEGAGDDGITNAAGGRYSRFTRTTVAEDGEVEYIIPINRPERAQGLIRQMLSEMGAKGRNIIKGFGLDDREMSGAMLGDMASSRLSMVGAYPTGGGMSVKSNSDNTIQSSPKIYVYSNDPVVAGQMVSREIDRGIRALFDAPG